MIKLSVGPHIVTILPERSGILSAWHCNGKPVFYEDEAVLTAPIIRGGMPILFPLCSDLPNESYAVDGKTYHMHRHGFARDMKWEVCEVSESEARLQLSASDETYQYYPYAFHMTVRYRLTAEGLTTRCTVKNDGGEPMPYQLGFHPYFATNDKAVMDLKYDWTQEVTAINPLKQEYDEVTFETDTFRLKLCEISGYDHIVIWSLPDKQFICVEPWLGTPGMLGQAHCHHIEASETFHHHFRIVVSEII